MFSFPLACHVFLPLITEEQSVLPSWFKSWSGCGHPPSLPVVFQIKRCHWNVYFTLSNWLLSGVDSLSCCCAIIKPCSLYISTGHTKEFTETRTQIERWYFTGRTSGLGPSSQPWLIEAGRACITPTGSERTTKAFVGCWRFTSNRRHHNFQATLQQSTTDTLKIMFHFCLKPSKKVWNTQLLHLWRNGELFLFFAISSVLETNTI